MSTRWTRRSFVGISGAACFSLRSGWAHAQAPTSKPPATPLTAEAVLTDLMDGNARFASGVVSSPRRAPKDFTALAAGQRPEALVIGCSDSRVPPEILFDQGVGDLFVVRVAGNVVNDAGAVVKGSIEYAVAELKVPLVVVLGHSNCGAVKTAVQHITDNDPLPGAIGELVALIKPAVERAKTQSGDTLENAVRANVALGVERIKSLSPILSDAVAAGRVKVIGATYELHTGKVRVVA